MAWCNARKWVKWRAQDWKKGTWKVARFGKRVQWRQPDLEQEYNGGYKVTKLVTSYKSWKMGTMNLKVWSKYSTTNPV